MPPHIWFHHYTTFAVNLPTFSSSIRLVDSQNIAAEP
jgi:hypothetical protein